MTSSEPDASRLPPAVLVPALLAMEPRPSALLVRRLVEGRSEDECATFYGVSPAAISVLVLRAAVDLARRAR
ncbi:hypothetical protein ACLESO_55960, partial [Pyxidicoccus sp. 3LG]